jgi:hypothetical protein
VRELTFLRFTSLLGYEISSWRQSYMKPDGHIRSQKMYTFVLYQVDGVLSTVKFYKLCLWSAYLFLPWGIETTDCDFSWLSPANSYEFCDNSLRYFAFLPYSQRWAADWTIVVLGFDSRWGAGNFSLNHLVQTGSWAHPASYPMGTRSSFPGGKAAGAWSWPLTSI